MGNDKQAVTGDEISEEIILQCLETAFLGKALHYFEEVTSTQNFAKEMSQSAPHGTVIVANSQSLGKGRLGRSWVSPRGAGVWLSMIIKPSLPISKISQLTLLSAVSVVETLKHFGVKSCVKWPNDCLVNGKKISGILTEMIAENGKVQSVIVGIGINVYQKKFDFDKSLFEKSTSIVIEQSQKTASFPLLRRDIIALLLKNWEKHYLRYLEHGFSVIKPLWEKYANVINKKVKVDLAEEIFTGVATGINDDGALIVLKSDGEKKLVYSGNITLL